MRVYFESSEKLSEQESKKSTIYLYVVGTLVLLSYMANQI
jgi:hypothetical protein